jgi:hypothetical protein
LQQLCRAVGTLVLLGSWHELSTVPSTHAAPRAASSMVTASACASRCPWLWLCPAAGRQRHD